MKAKMVKPICIACGTDLSTKRTDAQTCSTKCRKALSRFVKFHGFLPTRLEYAAMHAQRTKHAINFLPHGKAERVARARTRRRK